MSANTAQFQYTLTITSLLYTTNGLHVYTQVQGAHLRALSHYYAAMVHMTIVKDLKKTESEDCK